VKTSHKIVLTIILAALCVAIFGCASPQTSRGEINLQYLRDTYASYNELYFHNRLKPAEIEIGDSDYMATTLCGNGGADCRIRFNPRYTLAPRVASITMLHEMCHVKYWGEDTDHGKLWRSCMLQLDAVGAFREILIDNYSEDL
jgi:hypothetical protein